MKETAVESQSHNLNKPGAHDEVAFNFSAVPLLFTAACQTQYYCVLLDKHILFLHCGRYGITTIYVHLGVYGVPMRIYILCYSNVNFTFSWCTLILEMRLWRPSYWRKNQLPLLRQEEMTSMATTTSDLANDWAVRW